MTLRPKLRQIERLHREESEWLSQPLHQPAAASKRFENLAQKQRKPSNCTRQTDPTVYSAHKRKSHTDFYATAGDHGNETGQVPSLVAFGEVKVATRLAQPIVEVMELLVLLFAHVALLWNAK